MKKMLLLALMSLILSPFCYAEDRSALALNVGAFNATGGNTAAEVGVEYRFTPLASFHDIIPAVGLTMNSDGGYWAHAGIRYDVILDSHWVLTPHFAASLYEDGGGKDLGYGLEFRTGLEIAYSINPDSHIGLGIYHLSNANLGDNNPGQESIYMSYSFSLD